MSPLEIPPDAAASPDSVELARIWAVRGIGQQFVLRHDAWKDPAAWGILLVDLARNIAQAHARDGRNENEVFQRILAGFKVEL